MTKPRPDADPAAAALAAKRRTSDRTCLFCGRAFTGLGGAYYCSASCRVKAFNRRKKAARVAAREVPDGAALPPLPDAPD